jgi:uncharacterized BrkB/YihY/UPF0761 family membrane protein
MVTYLWHGRYEHPLLNLNSIWEDAGERNWDQGNRWLLLLVVVVVVRLLLLLLLVVVVSTCTEG